MPKEGVKWIELTPQFALRYFTRMDEYQSFEILDQLDKTVVKEKQ